MKLGSARSAGWQRAMRSLAIGAGTSIFAACVTAPDPPAPPQGLEQLQDQYDNPTAQLPASLVRSALSLASQAQPAPSLSYLSFVTDDANKASAATAANATSSDAANLQGTVGVHAVCPGNDKTSTPDETANGAVDLTLGVNDTQIQRAFHANATRCRFAASEGAIVVVTAAFDVDLGANVALGAAIPDTFLFRGANATGSVTAADGTVSPFTREEIDFRLTSDGTTEVLIDLAQLGLGNLGTAVLEFHSDQTIGLRERDGEWTCGSGSAPCVLH